MEGKACTLKLESKSDCRNSSWDAFNSNRETHSQLGVFLGWKIRVKKRKSQTEQLERGKKSHLIITFHPGWTLAKFQ